MPELEELIRERFGPVPTAGEPTCVHCFKSLDPTSPQVYRKVTGWEKCRGKGDGVHPIKNREFLGEFVHALCLDIMTRTGKQEALTF